jgi:uncharacterized protein
MREATKSITAFISACLASWIAGYPIAASAQVASFECARAAIEAEATICRVASLGAKDVELATLYRVLVTVHPARSGMAYREFRDNQRDRQTEWLKKVRDACKDDVDCLLQAYDRRIKALSSTIIENLGLTFGQNAD